MEAKRRVLIVDDDEVIRSVFKEGLRISGYECKTASSGTAAMERIEEESFDLMITDIIMPGMDGFELTELARKRRPELSVIVMTGFQQEESASRAVAAGASDFIKKPFTIEELVMRIERVARDAGIYREIRARQQEVRDIAREMVQGVQAEAMKKIAGLEQQILELRKRLS